MHFTRRQVLYGTAAATAALAFAPRSFAQQGLADSLNSALRAPVERGDIVGAIGADHQRRGHDLLGRLRRAASSAAAWR